MKTIEIEKMMDILLKKDCHMSIDDFYFGLDLTLSQIASDYIPFVKEEKIEVHNSKIYYTELDGRLIDVQELSIAGKPVKYRLMPRYLQVESNGEAMIRYCYLPSNKRQCATIIVPDCLSEETIALGVIIHHPSNVYIPEWFYSQYRNSLQKDINRRYDEKKDRHNGHATAN